MFSKLHHAILIAAALYIVAYDIWTAIYGEPGAASLELEPAAISQGMVIPE